MSSISQQEQSDEDIVAKVQAGDIESFGFLVERYEQKMLRYARKFLFHTHDAEDLVQDVFLKAYTNIQGFDVKRRFSPWLYRIAHNTFINAIKQKKKEPIPLFDFDTIASYFSLRPTAPIDIDKSLNKEIIEECLDKLDAKYREPLLLYYIEDVDYKTIADILRIPISTVGVRLNRGKALLKKIYSELYD